MRHPVPADNISSDKFGNMSRLMNLKRHGFQPLRKIVNSYQNKFMTIRRVRKDLTDDVDPPGGERPWRRHAIQQGSRHMFKVSINITPMTFPNIQDTCPVLDSANNSQNVGSSWIVPNRSCEDHIHRHAPHP